MALTGSPKLEATRLARFGLTTADADRLAAFYETAIGCRRVATDRRDGGPFAHLMGVQGGASGVTLALGDQTLELLQFDQPGRPYPGMTAADELVFQHFAIVVSDMAAAWERLRSVTGWTAISLAGPRVLPEASGGVTAFKFRDPEGHPLELLAFPPAAVPMAWRSAGPGQVFQGIDHSAISVSDTSASTAFYEGLGFRVRARTLNSGPEQSQLDAVEGATVEVVALALLQETPHLELLGYRGDARRRPLRLRSNDVAATRLYLQESGRRSLANPPARRLEDPDGHHLIVVD